MATATRIITIPSDTDPVSVLGSSDTVLNRVEQAFPEVDFLVRSNEIRLQAHSANADEQAKQAVRLLTELIESASIVPANVQVVEHMLDEMRMGSNASDSTSDEPVKHTKSQRISGSSHRKESSRNRTLARQVKASKVLAYAAGRPVMPKTRGQSAYVSAINTHTITFGVGPAGTGKTYLAVAKAVQAFKSQLVSKIILTRPAVEAGENLGFLPGGLTEKVDPYLRPLYDALSDMLGADRLQHFMENGSIEVAPLAYMRGRTLNDAFVILDEAQNTTRQQMKMFLTRLGFNSTMVITGDTTQVDLGLPSSGLVNIEQILKNVDDIAFVHLGAKDVVRHELVGHIVEAYDQYASQLGQDNVRQSRKPSKERA